MSSDPIDHWRFGHQLSPYLLPSVNDDPDGGQRSSIDHPSSNFIHRTDTKSIKVDGRKDVFSVALFADGKHIVSGGSEKKMRCWRVADGHEMESTNAADVVFDVTASADGKWVVGGLANGHVMVWSAEGLKRVAKFKAHSYWVRAVDVSADGKRIASGSGDTTVCVWSCPDGQYRLLGPLKHSRTIAAVKFSPDGQLIATATSEHDSVRVYDGQDGHLLFDAHILVNSLYNRSLAWADDSKTVVALSRDGEVGLLDVAARRATLKWPIHGSRNPTCISLASNGKFVAVSDDSSVSFWDIATHKQIGFVVVHSDNIESMTMSSSHVLVVAGGKTITIRNLRGMLPSSYLDNHVSSVGESSNKNVQHQRQEAAKEGNLQRTVHVIRTQPHESQQKFEEREYLLRAHEQKHRCEDLYAKGRIFDAASALDDFVNTMYGEVGMNKLFVDWLTDFTDRCALTLEQFGDDASRTEKHDEALRAYYAILALGHSPPDNLVAKWARTAMTVLGSVNEALLTSTKLKLPRFTFYRAICDVLEQDGRVVEAIVYFGQMRNELKEDTSTRNQRGQWELDFQQRCAKALERLADIAMEAKNYDKVVEHLSIAQSLDGADQTNISNKRHKALVLRDPWRNELNDADEAIKLDPSSYRGYESRFEALHKARRYAEAVEALDKLLSDFSHDVLPRYIDARPTLRKLMREALSHMPRILIDATTGRLYDKDQQGTVFESLPIWNELVSSMAQGLDHARIESEVKKFTQYVMLSHTWEQDEPLLQKVKNMSVYDLEPSPTNTKLQEFCSLVRQLGFRWAWADTTCIDQENNVVLQESLVAMFVWYRGSSLTLVYLRDVSSESGLSLQHSKWNTRGWTYQEYVAAETVRFYTGDWKPYLGLDMANHKESPIVRAEMQQATGVSSQEMEALRPGLDRIRQKLYVASMRQTTRMEDIAYSLLGIFNVAIPVIYGEGKRAVGRFLEHILTGSGDVAILAWTGLAGNYNSCLPLDLAVYKELEPPHIPRSIEIVEIDKSVAELRSSLSSSDLSLAISLLNRLKALPSASIASTRLRLPGILLPLDRFVCKSDGVYHTTSPLFGDIEVKTTCDLSKMEDLFLIYPWIRSLLDRRSTNLDEETQALRLLVRLRRPFGALLLELQSNEHKRVASDSLIMLQLREDAPLQVLVNGVHLAVEIQ